MAARGINSPAAPDMPAEIYLIFHLRGGSALIIVPAAVCSLLAAGCARRVILLTDVAKKPSNRTTLRAAEPQNVKLTKTKL